MGQPINDLHIPSLPHAKPPPQMPARELPFPHAKADGHKPNRPTTLFSIKAQLPPIPSPDQENLAELEQATPPTGIERFLALSHLAVAAFDAAEFNKAEDYARELLSALDELPCAAIEPFPWRRVPCWHPLKRQDRPL